jgi:hypothetical protein
MLTYEFGSGEISTIDVQVNQSTGPSPVRKACVTRVAMCSGSETYEEPSEGNTAV